MKYSKSMANLYHYVNFQPKEISGFSRLEIQGESVRVSVKLCFPKMESGCLKLYIIHDKAGRLNADLISEGKMRQRVFTMQRLFSKGDIENMHITPEKIKGVYIVFSDSAQYYSFWEKEEIDARKIIVNEHNAEEDNIDEEKMVIQEDDEQDIVEKENEPNEYACEQNEEKELECKEEPAQEPEYEELKIEEEAECEEVKIEEEAECEEKVKIEEEAECEEKVKIEEAEYEENNELLQECEAKNEINANSFADFEKINLMELRKLPKSEWAIANNSFLLHGYYNYHYISMKKEKNKLIIGIPGVFHPKEQQVARYFGFDSFMPERNEEVINDTFGYWCRTVDINE